MKPFKYSSLSALVAFALAGCSTDNLSEQQEAKSSIINMVNAIDSKAWQTVEE